MGKDHRSRQPVTRELRRGPETDDEGPSRTNVRIKKWPLGQEYRNVQQVGRAWFA